MVILYSEDIYLNIENETLIYYSLPDPSAKDKLSQGYTTRYHSSQTIKSTLGKGGVVSCRLRLLSRTTVRLNGGSDSPAATTSDSREGE